MPYSSNETEALDKMYPDIYYQVYPIIKQTCEAYDVPSNTGMYPYPTRASVEQMTELIYQNVAPTVPLTRQGYYPGYPGYPGYPAYPGVYPGGFLRPLIAILLIRELLARRGIFSYY